MIEMIKLDELRTLLPHSGKMLLLSRIIDYNIESGNNTLIAEYDITPNCVFYDQDSEGVPSWVGFELIAQAASAILGIRDRALGIKPKIGLLLSVSSLKIEIPVYKNGSTISIRVKEIDHTDSIYTFNGEIYLEDKLAIKCKIMTIEINEEEAKKLNIEGLT